MKVNARMKYLGADRGTSKDGKPYFYVGLLQGFDSERVYVNEEMYIVDLPGYGYAKVSKEVAAKWGPMIENYLHTSEQLRMVFLLIDLRHKPTNNDVQMYRWILSNGFSPVIVATKADKIKRSQLQKQLKLLKDTLKVIEGVPIVPFSAVTKAGRDEIWELIEEYALTEE